MMPTNEYQSLAAEMEFARLDQDFGGDVHSYLMSQSGVVVKSNQDDYADEDILPEEER